VIDATVYPDILHDSTDASCSFTTVPRTLANTETVTSKVAQTQTNNTTVIDSTKLIKISFSGFDVSNYYEGDMLALWFNLQDDGANNVDVDVWSLEVSGVIWTHGDPV